MGEVTFTKRKHGQYTCDLCGCKLKYGHLRVEHAQTHELQILRTEVERLRPLIDNAEMIIKGAAVRSAAIERLEEALTAISDQGFPDMLGTTTDMGQRIDFDTGMARWGLGQHENKPTL